MAIMLAGLFAAAKHDCSTKLTKFIYAGNELRAITSAPPPDPASWAFVPENDLLFTNSLDLADRLSPEDWVARGLAAMQQSLSAY